MGFVIVFFSSPNQVFYRLLGVFAEDFIIYFKSIIIHEYATTAFSLYKTLGNAVSSMRNDVSSMRNDVSSMRNDVSSIVETSMFLLLLLHTSVKRLMIKSKHQSVRSILS